MLNVIDDISVRLKDYDLCRSKMVSCSGDDVGEEVE